MTDRITSRVTPPGRLHPVGQVPTPGRPSFGQDAPRISKVRIDTSVARESVEFPLTGTFLAAMGASGSGVKIQVRLNDDGGAFIDVQEGFSIRGVRFDRIFVTNNAQGSGSFLDLTNNAQGSGSFLDLIASVAEIDYDQGVRKTVPVPSFTWTNQGGTISLPHGVLVSHNPAATTVASVIRIDENFGDPNSKVTVILVDDDVPTPNTHMEFVLMRNDVLFVPGNERMILISDVFAGVGEADVLISELR